jgi:hypothetical protein
MYSQCAVHHARQRPVPRSSPDHQGPLPQQRHDNWLSRTASPAASLASTRVVKHITLRPVRPGHDRAVTSHPTVKPRSNNQEARFLYREPGL